MIAIEPDGAYILLTLDAGLNAVTLRLTMNEFAHIVERGRLLLFPAPVPEGGPDEEIAA